MKLSIEERYQKLLEEVVDLNLDIEVYAQELARRHRAGWRIPTSTYRRCRDILYYKSSLERNSCYYVDLFKVEDKDNLSIILKDICNTIRIKNYNLI